MCLWGWVVCVVGLEGVMMMMMRDLLCLWDLRRIGRLNREARCSFLLADKMGGD